ncbi:MAG: hypothetical protein ACHQVS_02010 [Candidatus Babeliales bacterium]
MHLLSLLLIAASFYIPLQASEEQARQKSALEAAMASKKSPEQERQEKLKDAIIKGNVETTQSLLDAKANPNASTNTDDQYYYPFLVMAVNASPTIREVPKPTLGKTDAVVKLLLSYKANVNAHTGFECRTALLESIDYNNSLLVRLILDHQADVHHRDINGRNALFETLRYLLYRDKKFVETYQTFGYNDLDGTYLTHLILTHPETTADDVQHAYFRINQDYIDPEDMYTDIHLEKMHALTNARTYAYECSRIELRELLKKFAHENGLQEKLAPGIMAYIADYAALYHHIPEHTFQIKEYRDNPKNKQLILYKGS